MTIKTYSDIETVGHVEDMTADDIRATDLRQEAHSLDAQDKAWELWRAEAYNSEGLEILYVPDASRAGVAWGSDADWTDCESAQDALERYFGVDGKEMCN